MTVKNRIFNILTESEQYSLLKLVEMCEVDSIRNGTLSPNDKRALYNYALGVFENHMNILNKDNFSFKILRNTVEMASVFKNDDVKVVFEISVALNYYIEGLSDRETVVKWNFFIKNLYTDQYDTILGSQYFKSDLTDKSIKEDIKLHWQRRIAEFNDELMKWRAEKLQLKLSRAVQYPKNKIADRFKVFYDTCKLLGIPK